MDASVGSRTVPRVYLSPPHLSGRELDYLRDAIDSNWVAPLGPGERGHGARTRVWVDGIAEPIVASRTERSILGEMGIRDAGRVQILDDAVKLAERIVEDAGKGRVDLADLDRRARKLLESTAQTSDDDQLF